MSSGNVPSDWGQYWTNCRICGNRYHESEGGCDCRDEGDCTHCGELCGRDDYNDEQDLFVCETCRAKELEE